MATEANVDLLRRAWDEIYSQGRVDSLEEFVLDDVVAHEPDGDVRGAEEFKRYLTIYLAASPDTSVSIEDVVAEGEKVVSRYTVRGTHTGATEDDGPPTGRQVAIEGITLYHFKDGNWPSCGIGMTTWLSCTSLESCRRRSAPHRVDRACSALAVKRWLGQWRGVVEGERMTASQLLRPACRPTAWPRPVVPGAGLTLASAAPSPDRVTGTD